MKKLFFIFLCMGLLISCQSETKKDPFLLSADHVGFLTKKIQIRQLDSIYANDSIVKEQGNGAFNNTNQIHIYDKKGNELLTLDPVQNFDSTSTIGNIEIIDKRFKTAKGLNTASTFKDIQKNYKISRIENTLRTAVIFIDEINAYVSIDKKELSGDAVYNTDVKIEPTQIPDDAKIKHFWIGWQ